MTLPQDLLAEALTVALKFANPPCSPWCRSSATVEGDQYRCAHNGLGSRDTANVAVYASKVTSMSREQITVHLRVWLESLHKGEPVDLNVSA